MKTSAVFIIRLAVISTMLFWLAGCGQDGDCPVCGSDDSTCDAGDDAGDIIAGDTGIDTTIHPDSTDSTEFTDTDVPEAASDATDDAETNDFLTGTGRIIGLVKFTNMEDHSGFEIKLYNYDTYRFTESPQILASTLSRQDGTYEISGIPSGVYIIVVGHGPMTKESQKYQGPFGVDEGMTETMIDLTFTATGSIDGNLVFKTDQLYPEFTLVFTKGRLKSVHPDESGLFRIDGLLPGQYTVCAGTLQAIGKCLDEVTVKGLELTSLGSIEMTYWSPNSGPGVNVTGNVKMFGMTDNSGIEVVYEADEPPMVTTTDIDGNYSFDNARPGIAEIRFSSPEGSGFERHSASLHYVLYAGTSELLPVQTLVRGEAIWRTDITRLAAGRAVFTPDSKNVVLRTWDYYSQSYPDYYGTLYSVDVVSGNRIKLADSVDRFKVSPDSKTVVYNHGMDGKLLFSVPLAGGNRECLTTESNGFLAFSPDSRFAIFHNYDDSSFAHVYASDVVTGNEHKLCDGSFHSVTSDSKTVYCWSPEQQFQAVNLEDGQSVYAMDAVSRFIPGSDGRTIFLCSSNGSAQTVDLETDVVTPLSDEIDDCRRTLLMPSMNAIIYQSSTGHLMAAPMDGGVPVLLANGDTFPLLATPDSTRVIYALGTGTEYLNDIYTVDITGLSQPVLLVSDYYGDIFNNDEDTWYPVRSFFVNQNSDALYIAVRFPERSSIELRRITLDGLETISFGYLYNTIYGDSDHPRWMLDENVGVVYAYKAGKKVQVLDMLTGELMYTSDSAIGTWMVAPDLSGTAIISDKLDGYVWMAFPELNYTLLGPTDPEPGVDQIEGNRDVAISPDSRLIMFPSTFGVSNSLLERIKDIRLMIAPLKQD